MLYKPKQCCECGEKIDRKKWGLLTSRRFCQTCESEFKKYDWQPRIVVGLSVIVALFGVGGLLKKENKPLNVTSAPLASIAGNVNQTLRGLPNANVQNPVVTQTATNTASQSSAIMPQQASGVNLKSSSVNQAAMTGKEQNAAPERVYFCGAETKKGTPCTRHVKRPGRCWQHEGQQAMLPPDKLVASR